MILFQYFLHPFYLNCFYPIVSKFFSRPKTSADKMVSIDSREINRRSRELAKLSEQISLEKNQNWIGWEGKVFFDEYGKGSSFVGRNLYYKPVVVKTEQSLFGNLVNVRIIDAYSTYLEGEII